MVRISSAMAMGLLVGLLGVAAAPLVPRLEDTGLDLLFRLRGARQAPRDVVVVSVDKASAQALGLPPEAERWPRAIHARLVEGLGRAGAAAVAFDIYFGQPRDPAGDRSLADAIARAGNVVLCSRLDRDIAPLPGLRGDPSAEMHVEKEIPPTSAVAEGVLAHAPWPLPKVPARLPARVSQYWAFKTGAGGVPTLPVVAFQAYALKRDENLLRDLEPLGAWEKGALPAQAAGVLRPRVLVETIRRIREIFEGDPSLGNRLLRDLDGPGEPGGEAGPLLRALVALYSGDRSRHLNYYGPPFTIPTVSYRDALKVLESPATDGGGSAFREKAVFVGVSERSWPDQKDGFPTPFSEPSGLDLSGVEIAATAFANLLEDLAVEPLAYPAHAAALFLWGGAAGALCLLVPTGFALLLLPVLGAGYLALALHQFSGYGRWYPLATPLLVQAPIALFGSTLWKYARARGERERISRAFKLYLPESFVEELTVRAPELCAAGKVVYGTCLLTDARQFTTLCEALQREHGPKYVAGLVGEYCETVFEPVRRRNGVVVNVVGDSMMALWASERPEDALRTDACLGALEIARAVEAFNRRGPYHLPTRVGLDAGYVYFGNVGAGGRYEYRAVGDAVNTASRLEGLNRHLGTRALASEAAVEGLGGLLLRGVGRFLLAGKTEPVSVFEPLCRIEEGCDEERRLLEVFERGLRSFQERAWGKAAELFRKAVEVRGGDGPSHFYLQLCEAHRSNPPRDWDGVIRFDQK